MTPPRQPTPRQLDLLRLLARENDRGGSPTFREIAAALGIRSTNAVSDLMIGLEARGLIEPRRIGAMRAARVTGAGRAMLGEVPPLQQSPSAAAIALLPPAWRSAFGAGYRRAERDLGFEPGSSAAADESAIDLAFADFVRPR